MKKLVLASAVAMALGASTAYAGALVTIDPDAAGGDAAIQVGALGWQDGNAISVGVLPGLEVGTLFQTYAHASLANFTDVAGDPIGGLGLNTGGGYEWTYVTGFQEVIASTVGTPPIATSTFQTVAGGDNFFQIYFDDTRDANNLAGTGFNNGTLILSGTIVPYNAATGEGLSAYTASGLGGPLDQFLGDNYPGITSVTGGGTALLLIDVDSYDAAFFTGDPQILALNFDTFQNTPYQQQNPSANFWDGTAFIDGVASVGSVNGVSGPNFMFQTRASNDFVTAVPEPASLALLGVGLIGLGLARRRKNQA